jgi:hypothetical protein
MYSNTVLFERQYGEDFDPLRSSILTTMKKTQSHKLKGSTAAINQRGQQQPYIKGINSSHKSKD